MTTLLDTSNIAYKGSSGLWWNGGRGMVLGRAEGAEG